MGNFQKGGSRGGFRGGDRGGNSGARGDFKKKSWGNDRGGNRDKGPVTLYQATCADCGRKCEVPFMPNGKKPVLCKECFGGNDNDKGGRSDSRESSRRDFAPRSLSNTFSNPSSSTSELQKSINELNAKVDKIISLFEKYNKNS